MALEQNRSVDITVPLVLDALHHHLAVLGSAQVTRKAPEWEGRLQGGRVSIPGLHIVPDVDTPEVSSQSGGDISYVWIGVHRPDPDRHPLTIHLRGRRRWSGRCHGSGRGR